VHCLLMLLLLVLLLLLMLLQIAFTSQSKFTPTLTHPPCKLFHHAEP
jgi:hypothetical protein